MLRQCSILLLCLVNSFVSYSQDITVRLKSAFEVFEKDSQLNSAIASLYVIDGKTGKVVFDKNGMTGLAPASTQKIITSVTAYEILGADFTYQTRFVLNPASNTVIVYPSGDPTLGSGRYSQTRSTEIREKIQGALRKEGVTAPRFELNDSTHDTQRIPDGWIWQDAGNYYGAGAGGFNWKENQADLFLQSGEKTGDPVIVKNYSALFPTVPSNAVVNELRTAAKGTGDNAYYYFGHGNTPTNYPYLKGTIPAGEKNFSISIAIADPWSFFLQEIKASNTIKSTKSIPGKVGPASTRNIYTHTSPSLDSIIYWFNRKSINLYGEALMKSIGVKGAGIGATDKGISILQEFWAGKGIAARELNMYDGSGLSPLNRVTTHAQVTMLQYAKDRTWFPAFYDALPLYNNMKMKSGTISDVKGFCGYHKAADGSEYIFSFLVNNYNGRASELVNKMYKVLNVLK